ncbi:ice-binding family protein [Pontibacter sp. MBLB2868]|uniref:ice-binding family protein n=1 Tax=Pontibacter sp. MBLB2868 TaxID=3451555 RepID=UPI003F7558C9
MKKSLLLIILCLIGTTTLSIAQSAPSLGKATTFAIIGSNYVSNTGTTGVTGDLGVTPQGIYTDDGQLLVRGTKQIGLPLVNEALQDARTVYDYYSNMTGTPFTGAGLVAGGSSPGIYRNSGNVDLDGIVVLDAHGDVNAKFVFIIDGDLTTPSIAPPAPGTGLLLQNGAQPQNIFWIVKGKVNLGNSTSFQGNIISLGDITLEPGVNLIGRAISLDGGVSLNTNNVFLPSVVLADLSVEKAATEGEYLIGDEVTYTITAHNAGPSTAYNVVVNEIIPAELEFVRVESASAGTYDPATKEWTIGEMQLNETAELKLTFRVIAAGDVVNKVSVGSNNPDPKPGNNDGEDPVDVPEVSADVSVSKTANSGPHTVGGTIIYTIEVKNNGPYTAEDVVVNELLSEKLELISFTASKGIYDPATGLFTVGSLANGETATLTIEAKILAAGEIKNTAGVGSSTPDKTPGDNTDIVVVEPSCPAPALSISGGASQCAETTAVTYTVTEVFGATYAFELTGGLTEVSHTGNSITVNIGTSAGTVKATVTDLCGNAYTVVKEVTVITKPEAPTIAGGSSVCANSTGNSYTAEGAPEGATYTWTADGDIQITGGQGSKTVQVSVGPNGGTLTVTAGNECFTSDASAITINTNQPPVSPANISGDTELCSGNEATYTIQATNGATGYTWTVPAGWTIIRGQGTTSITVKAGAGSGNVSVIAENDCGASTGTALGVTVNEKPQTPAGISGTADACAGKDGFTYTVSPVDGATGYTWTVPAGWTIVSGQGTTNITVTAGTAGGNVTVVAENECGSSTPAEMPLTVSKAPEAPLAITGDAAGCVGSSLTYSVGETAGAEAYTWTVPAGWTITSGQGTGTITVTVGDAPGDITVTAKNKCGASSGISKAVSPTPPPVTPGAISGPSATCGGTSDLVYSIASVPGATGYTWTVPAGWTIVSGQGSTEIKVTAGSGSGDVTVTADNACGASAAAIYTTSVNNAPQAPLTIHGSSSGCIGSVLTYSIDDLGGATGYTWTVPAGWTIKSGQGSTTIEVEAGNNPGMITVAGTNECGTGATASIAVSPTTTPNEPGAVEGPDASCANSGENLVYSITVLTSGETYNWTVPDGWTIVSGQGTYSITVSAGDTGGKVSVTASNDCGTSTASSLDVEITTPPAATTQIKDMSSLCNGLMYTVNPVPGATGYTWTLPAGFTIVSGQGSTTIVVKADNPNSFGEVSVVANNGNCSSPVTSLPIDTSVLDGELEFPKAFSPNGDGKNDTWVIANLTKYPKNQVIIFNRWGSEVYKKDNYQNDWNGNKLEQGTYYYKVSVTLCDGVEKVFTGYVTIFR